MKHEGSVKMFKTAIVHNINEYIKFLSTLPSGYKWFRGHSDAYFRLIPSAMRNAYAIEDWMGNKFDKPFPDRGDSGSSNTVAFLPVPKMVAEFKKRAKKYVQYPVANDLEWECIGQHYGLPTSLLDWTINPLDALYFAVFDCEIGKTQRDDVKSFINSGFSSSGGAIFIIDPIEINRCTLFPDRPNLSRIADLVSDYDGVKNHFNSILPPICVAGMNKEKRICRQSGNFTMHSSFLWPMDYYEKLQERMFKVLIPYNCYKRIRKSLETLNITHDTIYVEDDEKDAIAREIASETRDKFMEGLMSRGAN